MTPPRDIPEGWGGGFFSGMEEGYSMTLHAKIGKPGCISFCFMIFFILLARKGQQKIEIPEGGGRDFFFLYEEGYGITIHAKNGKPGFISFRFMIILFSEGGHLPH